MSKTESLIRTLKSEMSCSQADLLDELIKELQVENGNR